MNRKEVIVRVSGCFIAVPTLFNEDYSLNLDGMEVLIRFMIEHGLREGNATILVNGATGEFPVLSLDERKKTAETVVRAADGRIGVIVGAQGCASLESMEIARHAQGIGATPIQVSAPRVTKRPAEFGHIEDALPYGQARSPACSVAQWFAQVGLSRGGLIGCQLVSCLL